MTTENGPVRPKAYSYIRFSTPEQALGDSLRRQTEAARDYAFRHGLDLDESLTFRDPGISAFRGLNAEGGNLGKFLEAVRSGLIESGSYLLVESLDRISRQTAMRAVNTMQNLVYAGINIVDLSDGGRLYNVDTLEKEVWPFVVMVFGFIRAHGESAAKSSRLLAVYDHKRAKAKEGVAEPFTRMLPAWLSWDEEAKRHVAVPARAGVVRTIFELADQGWGQHRIAAWLNEQGVPTWGGKGKQRKAELWHRSYVKKLLNNPAVVGTFTPRQKRDAGDGKRRRDALDPIENYFPSVVEKELFERVIGRTSGAAPRGRNSSAPAASIFAGVVRCVHCDGLVTRVSKGTYVYLLCSKANRNGVKACKYQAVTYRDVEDALRVNAEAVISEAPRGLEAEELEEELAHLEAVVDQIGDEARELADELIIERSGVIRTRLREKEAELKAAQESLRGLLARRDAVAKPHVQRKLKNLRDALTQEPLNVVEANKALRDAVSRIVLDPGAGTLTIHWQHSTKPTEVMFLSRHSSLFDDSTTVFAPSEGSNGISKESEESTADSDGPQMA